MTEQEFRSMNLDIDQIIDKLPLHPKFTKQQMIEEADYMLHEIGDIEFAQKIKRTIQEHPDATIYVYFNRDFYPVSDINDIVNIPGLLNRLTWRIELDCDDET